MVSVLARIQGSGLMARALRSASWMILGYGGSQAMRLASNLILTRILFPEAFGMMALVTVIITGLTLFSDVGIGPSILQSERGDDPIFLDTAWTIQAIRGCFLWGLTFVLAWPVAHFYDVAELSYLLPLAGTVLVVEGFKPTRIETAHRHLMVGRVTQMELLSQLVSLVIMVVVAALTQSVLALVLGSVLQSLTYVLFTHLNLPGHKNRFRWDRKSALELMGFGKWIFLSTAFWFVTSQGDRAILGKFLSLETLGIYNIAFFLASFPLALGYAVNQRLMIPVYRDVMGDGSPHLLRKQRLLRFGLSGGVLVLVWAIAMLGPWLVGILYDQRYSLAGSIIVPLALAQSLAVIVMTYDQAALAAGDSKNFFVLGAIRAVSQTALFIGGVMWFGLPGGIAALALAMCVTYPAIISLARKHHVWDPIHDIAMISVTLIVGGGVLYLHWNTLTVMVATLGNQ